MARTGEIALLSIEGNPIKFRIYKTILHRTTIIENWKQLYGKLFDSCYIQITPEHNFLKEHFNEDGINKKVYKKPKKRLKK